jgi:branched-chain amino acid transport system substrate-binding protein
MYLAKVKGKADVKEDWDYEQIVATVPGAEAFEPASTECKMS